MSRSSLFSHHFNLHQPHRRTTKPQPIYNLPLEKRARKTSNKNPQRLHSSVSVKSLFLIVQKILHFLRCYSNISDFCAIESTWIFSFWEKKNEAKMSDMTFDWYTILKKWDIYNSVMFVNRKTFFSFFTWSFIWLNFFSVKTAELN